MCLITNIFFYVTFLGIIITCKFAVAFTCESLVVCSLTVGLVFSTCCKTYVSGVLSGFNN